MVSQVLTGFESEVLGIPNPMHACILGCPEFEKYLIRYLIFYRDVYLSTKSFFQDTLMHRSKYWGSLQ